MEIKKYTDLHTHTTFSDGTFTPEELIIKAKEIKLASVAITDHDTVDGIPDALEAGKKHGLKVIPGIEIATHYTDEKETEIHIVGLFIDHKNEKLNFLLKGIIENRESRNLLMVKKLNELGFDVSYDELKDIAGGSVISRAHYARLLVEKGYVNDMYDAFSKYIGDGKKAFVKRSLLKPEDAIKAITDAGGVAILAHPTLYDMNFRQIRKMASEFMEYGLKGIEVMYSTYTYEQEHEVTRIADDLGLLYSGGSDFHGTNKKGIHLGVGKGSLRIPCEFAEKIEKSR